MKKIISLIILIFINLSPVNAQKELSIQGKKVKDGVIYLTFDGRTMEYFTPDKIADSKKTVAESMSFALKDDNSCNIYLKWINPLRYRLTWKDTTYIDERDKAINDFANLLVLQFGIPMSSLDNEERKTLLAKSFIAPIPVNETEFYIPDGGFNNTDLTLLYIQLRSQQNLLEEEDRKSLNVITKSIASLDDVISIDISKEVDKIFTELMSMDNPTGLLNIIESKDAEIKKYEEKFAIIESLQNEISQSISKMTLKDNLLNIYAKTIISKFINQTTTLTATNKNLTNKLKPVLEIIKNSLNDESTNAYTKGFYKLRSVGFEDGKNLKTTLTISEFEYIKETKDFYKKSVILNKSLTFQKYDFFAISVSTGLFYSSTTLKGYGVSGESGEQFTISEDNITKSNAVTAAFLNFNFGIGSRYFAPLAQIGIDPTKKRPFLLLGGGFSVPSARIAITGGPIWTWNPSLDQLTVGQSISSTTDLEKDIQYRFDVKPKGWYLGLQYNF